MDEKKTEDKKTTEQLSQKVEEQLKKVVDQGITSSNIDYAYKLVDIHKDLANEKYWEKKGEMIEMRYTTKACFSSNFHNRKIGRS